jgi:hypothetical protein
MDLSNGNLIYFSQGVMLLGDEEAKEVLHSAVDRFI